MAFLEYRVSSSESGNSLFLSVLCVIVIILWLSISVLVAAGLYYRL